MSKGILSRPAIHLIFIVLLGVIVYSNTFQVPFLFDDESSIINNPVIRNLGGFLSGNGYDYNPRRFIGYLTIALNYRLGELDVTGYHAFNLAVHITAALLVYALTRLTLQTPFFRNAECGVRSAELITQNSKLKTQNFMPLLAALLFVSHPVQTQAVTYIIQRLASLATMFYLASLVLYIQARFSLEEGKRSSTAAWYLLSLLSAVLAMKTKEIAVTLPAVVLLYEFYFFRGKVGKRLLFLLPLLLTIVIVPLSMMGGDKPAGELLSDLDEKAKAGIAVLPRWDYLITQFRVIVTYIRLLFVPLNQNLDYDYPVNHSLFAPPVFLSFLFLVALFGLAVYLFFRSTFNVQCPTLEIQNSKFKIQNSQSAASRLVSFGILWFFITLSVESSVIPIADVIFEHRLYLPSVGFFMAFAGSVMWGKERIATVFPAAEKLLVPMLALILLLLSASTHARNDVWVDGIRLWEDVVSKSPGMARGHSALGVFYDNAGRTEEALRESQIAVRLDPGDFRMRGNLGALYAKNGLMEEAVRELQAAIALKPDFAEAHSSLGIVFAQQGRFDDAIRELETSIRLKPDNADGYNNLGIVYARQGRTEEALREFRNAVTHRPEDAEAHYNLGAAYAQLRLFEDAVIEFRTALRLRPDYANAAKGLENIQKSER